jgi:hypothetical protein
LSEPARNMGDFDPAIHRALTRSARHALKLVARIEAAVRRPFGPDAPAFADQGLWGGSRDQPLGRFPFTLSGVALGVAADHLRSYVRLMEVGPFPIYSLLTLVRTPLETAALCRWLVDPTVPPRERVARGVAAQLEDYRQRRSFEQAIGAGPQTEGSSGSERYADLLQDRADASIDAVVVPAWSALISMFGPRDLDKDASWAYRLASAFAHGYAWSSLATKLGEGTRTAPGILRGPVSAHEGVVLIVGERAIKATELAAADFERYVG